MVNIHHYKSLRPVFIALLLFSCAPNKFNIKVSHPKEYPNIPISSCGEAFTRRPITIDYSGNLRICNHSPTVIGNIYSDAMQKMAGSAYINTWKVTQPAYCQPCTQWEKCLGGCRAASEQAGKSLDYEDPVDTLMNQKCLAE